jgi:hypothetical protein
MQRPHPKKEIEAALAYAEACGWRVQPKRGNGHAWGKMLCPYNSADCRCGEFCITSIWSTPRCAANHAKDLRRVVDHCAVLRQIAAFKSKLRLENKES